MSISFFINFIDSCVIGSVSNFAGTADSNVGYVDGGMADAVAFMRPSGMAFDLEGNMYVSDTNHNVLRRISTIGEFFMN